MNVIDEPTKRGGSRPSRTDEDGRYPSTRTPISPVLGFSACRSR